MSNTANTGGDAATIADLARKASVVQSVESADGRQHLIIPEGYTTKDVTDPHGLYPRTPAYIKQAVEVQALDSLIEYVNAFKTPHTKLFANINANSITGLIDYHQQDGKAANVAHSVTMELPFSEEWVTWMEIDGKLMDQLSFARFLEENHPDIAQPTAAELIEMARDLHAVRNVRFTKVVRTDSDNESFTVDDSTTLNSTRSSDKLELPRQFTLKIPVYFGERPIEMSAFLRWRVDQTEGMKLGIKMWRPEHVRQAMFKEIVLDAAGRTELVAVYGTAAH
jgi:uncharacterized protein YfdQ (DUF2303 family)